MKKMISIILSFMLFFGCSITTFAADANYRHAESLPNNGVDYFETEVKGNNEESKKKRC